jgi:hypothetical protein
MKERLTDLATIALERDMPEKIVTMRLIEDFISKDTNGMLLFK